MPGWVHSVKEQVMGSSDFRRVLYTAPESQLVAMTLAPEEEIGEEVHDVDQFLYIVEGEGRAVVNGDDEYIAAGYGVFVPRGTKHNITNTSPVDKMYLFTVYAPPEHPEGAVHATKEEAEAAEQGNSEDVGM